MLGSFQVIQSEKSILGKKIICHAIKWAVFLPLEEKDFMGDVLSYHREQTKRCFALKPSLYGGGRTAGRQKVSGSCPGSLFLI